MREKLIKCIHIGYDEMILELENEEKYGTPDYDEDFNSFIEKLPIDGDEAQYAWEFGRTMASEMMDISEDSYDEYLEDILMDSDSELTLNEL